MKPRQETVTPFGPAALPLAGQDPLILEIKGNSLDDGPGIRTVVFFKGCPLDCVWCHNPESKAWTPELSYDPAACVGCLTCTSACPHGALDRSNPSFVDRDACTLCFACTEVCPSGALARVGVPMSVEAVVGRILPDRPFFVTSGGGATLSGGEPTLFMGYASRLLERLKEEGIHTLVETCGLFDPARFREGMLTWTDAVYFDLKIFDAQDHRRFCGADNRVILSNFAALSALAGRQGFELLPRVPLVPGITDTERNIISIAAYLKQLGHTRLALLPYNPLWGEKCEKIGKVFPFAGEADKTRWYDRTRLARVREILSGFGIEAL
ncbi:MAG TPA: glycyl-radical enzyme activating protein [Deltaproteobacteria bacterium]|nr:glycyl-radical enzyme activating protein [Deltaproteobacteria bacterium]